MDIRMVVTVMVDMARNLALGMARACWAAGMEQAAVVLLVRWRQCITRDQECLAVDLVQVGWDTAMLFRTA